MGESERSWARCRAGGREADDGRSGGEKSDESRSRCGLRRTEKSCARHISDRICACRVLGMIPLPSISASLLPPGPPRRRKLARRENRNILDECSLPLRGRGCALLSSPSLLCSVRACCLRVARLIAAASEGRSSLLRPAAAVVRFGGVSGLASAGARVARSHRPGSLRAARLHSKRHRGQRGGREGAGRRRHTRTGRSRGASCRTRLRALRSRPCASERPFGDSCVLHAPNTETHKTIGYSEGTARCAIDVSGTCVEWDERAAGQAAASRRQAQRHQHQRRPVHSTQQGV